MKRFLTVILCAPILFLVACATTAKTVEKTSKGPAPLIFFIGDGAIRMEQMQTPEVAKDRKTAAFFMKKLDAGEFNNSKLKHPATAWVEESSEYELMPQAQRECEITIEEIKPNKAPASGRLRTSYQIKVRVKDGIEQAPFESLINGESEGEIYLGEYPVSAWKSDDRLVIDDTVIPYWAYTPKTGHYEIVKQMGEDRFLRKRLKFDPYLKAVSQVDYEILSDSGGQVVDQMGVLARFSCSAS